MGLTPLALVRSVESNGFGVVVISIGLVLCLALLAVFVASGSGPAKGAIQTVKPYMQFFYATFLKSHQVSAEHGQQSALESFYATQAAVYDATRRILLHGREDMLGILAGQIQIRFDQKNVSHRKPIWVDVGAGTGWNVEQMDRFTSIEDTFEHVYLVDLSPSLCEVARDRVKRLGWRNVSVICQDARSFHPTHGKADLITLSYSLSMIPDYYSVVDSLRHLLSPVGLIGVCDFYVQSIVDVQNRNWIGGSLNRHVNWLGRLFWRAWFDADRVNLDGGRRDFLEWSFGTILSTSGRNYTLCGIPYYIFVGCGKSLEEPPEKVNAALTESPYLSAREHQAEMLEAARDTTALTSKAYESAVVNLAANLPLPAAFYQLHHWRIYYNDLLRKHQQFDNSFIYGFNWEDPQTDRHILNIRSTDVILAITSAGDNILDMLLERPRRIHAVDLNPNQGHLLELKVAAFTALSHDDTWQLFGLGKHPQFRNLLLHQLSPHMSSNATQFWLNHAQIFTSAHGLYESGGSGLAIRLVRRLVRLSGLTSQMRTMCTVDTLNEQRELWPSIRRVLMSWPLHYGLVSTGWWAWKAGGVPQAQRQMILLDYADAVGQNHHQVSSGAAIWKYLVDTFDPVIRDTLLSRDNYFYHLCLQGRYSRKSHPRYLSPRAHARLSQPSAFDGLRIHTDELIEVISRLRAESLTIAILMDSMDWFEPTTPAAAQEQVAALHKVLAPNGRVLLRSAGLKPWYIPVFERGGFRTECVKQRDGSKCVDRVNMYASTWVCTKIVTRRKSDSRSITPRPTGRVTRSSTSASAKAVLADLDLGVAAMS